jgi:TIR domain
MTNPYVFISYSRQDRQFVDRLSEELNRAGVETWTDTQNIGAGENWQAKIESGLLGAAVLIYVASAQASTSGWVQMELQAYLERAGRIIPVIIDDAGPTSIPDFLGYVGLRQ